LRDPERHLKRQAEARDLARRLTAVRQLLHRFPPLLGEVGQPGCFTVALGRQPISVQMFKNLDIGQRLTLAMDWHKGHKLLFAHHRFLRTELHTCRNSSLPGRLVRAMKAFYQDRPILLLLLLVIVALGSALCISFWPRWNAIRETDSGVESRQAATTKPGEPESVQPATIPKDLQKRENVAPIIDSKAAIPKPGEASGPQTPEAKRVGKRSEFEGPHQPILSVALLPSKGVVLACTERGSIWSWTLNDEQGTEKRKPDEKLVEKLEAVAFSSDGNRVILAQSLGAPMLLLDLRSESGATEFKNPSNKSNPLVRCVAFSPKGDQEFCGGDDHFVQVWNNRGEVVPPPYKGHDKRVNCIAIAHDVSRLASGSDDTTVRVWDTKKHEGIKSFPHGAKVTCLAISPHGETVASGGEDNVLRLWDVEKAKCVNAFEGQKVNAVSFSPDGTRLLTGGEDGTIRLLNAKNGQELQSWKHEAPVLCVTFFDDRQAVSGDAGGTVILWGLPKP
jgi:WD40 repeat protein